MTKCFNCESEIDQSKNYFTLILGPNGLRRKAKFCAKDCLLNCINNKL